MAWLPGSIDTKLEWGETGLQGRRARSIQQVGAPAINTNNFLFRVLKEAGTTAGVPGVTHRVLRRICSTHMAQLTTVKDVQNHLRHTNAKTTLEHHIKLVPKSV
jgi:integrase